MVVAGDTLWAIAERHSLTVEDLLVANPQITDRRVIRPGDTITISPIYLGGLDASAMNDRGQVVGRSQNHAVLWQDGVMTDLGTLGGWRSEATGINNLGQVVGVVGRKGGDTAFLWQDGVMTELRGPENCDEAGCIPGSPSVSAINDAGQVVGATSFDFAGPSHAALWDYGSWIDLGDLGGNESWATAINERGQVVGGSENRHAFLWQNGVMTDLGDLGGNQSWATAINDRGQIVGRSDTEVVTCEVCGVGNYHAFLWQDEVMTDLGTLGGSMSVAVDINQRGQVLGFSDDHVVVWFGDVAIDLALRGVDGYPVAVNDCGDVVAQRDTPDGGGHAYLWRGVAAASR